MRLGTRTGQEALKEESKQHSNMKECSEPQGQFGTFGMWNSSLKWPNFHVMGFGPMAFK